jgi:serine/threonine-protein kinase
MAPLLLELGRDRSLRKRLIVAAALGAGAAGMTGVLYLLAVAGVIAPPDADPPSTNLGATEVGRLAAEARSSGGDAHETGSTGDEGDSIRAELQTIEALIRAGRYADALPMAQAAVTRAREADEGKLLAIAHYREGSLHGYLGDPAAAERSFIDAMLAGKQHDAPDVQSEAAIRLVHVVGYVQRRFDDADPWIRTAQALVDASGDERQQSTLASYIGTVRFAEGDYASAETYQRRALELEEALLGPDHADLASTLNNLAGALAEQGRPEEALPLRERALRIIIAQRGAEHPQVSDHLRGVGALLFQLGRASEAHEHWVRALELRREAYGDEHPDVATSLDDLGNALEALGQDEEAITRLREALAMREKLLGKHPEVAATLSNLGRVLTKTGRNDEAIILHERAVALTEESLGHEHAEVATKLANLAVAYREVGRRDDAVETYARALEIREATLGPEHSQTSRTRALLDTLRAEPR